MHPFSSSARKKHIRVPQELQVLPLIIIKMSYHVVILSWDVDVAALGLSCLIFKNYFLSLNIDENHTEPTQNINHQHHISGLSTVNLLTDDGQLSLDSTLSYQLKSKKRQVCKFRPGCRLFLSSGRCVSSCTDPEVAPVTPEISQSGPTLRRSHNSHHTRPLPVGARTSRQDW